MVKYFSIFFIVFNFLSAQNVEVYFNQSAEELFLLGMRQYSQKEFKPAYLSFQQSINSMPNNHRITASMMMAAKSQYAMKNFRESLELCDSLLSQFPETSYREDVYFTRGMCYYNLADYHQTFDEMYNTYVIAEQRLNKEHSYKVIDHIATEFLSLEEVEALISDTLNVDIINDLLVTIAEKYVQNGEVEQAKSTIERMDYLSAAQPLQFRVNKLLSRIEKGNLVRLGVLLPLQNSNPVETREKKVVHEILEGIQLAVNEYEERINAGEISVELDIQDSQKDSAVIDLIISAWSGDSTIAGIIGPVFSTETEFAAVIAQRSMIPLVTPTATDEGIAAIGPYVFQANSTNGAKGKTMAQYAVQDLGARTIAVLSSAVQSSSIQADSFIVEAQRLGANVLIDRRFQKGESDLRSYVRDIRLEGIYLRPDYVLSLKEKPNIGEITRKLLSVGIRFSLIDSLINAEGVFNFTAFFGDTAKQVADSLQIPVRRTALYRDSLNYPVSTIDLIYCPISNSHEIGVLTSQVAFYNIKSILLGSGDWNDANELELNKRYADGVIFGSDRWIERTDHTNRIFSRYTQRYGKQITDNVLFGYDAMSMIISRFNEGVLTRDQLAEALADVFEFRGIRNSITFRPDRVNSSLHILQFKNSAVTKIKSYSSN